MPKKDKTISRWTKLDRSTSLSKKANLDFSPVVFCYPLISVYLSWMSDKASFGNVKPDWSPG